MGAGGFITNFRTMNTCACGRVADGDGTQCLRCAALQQLGLKAGASEAETKAAHRLHVMAWHPDRFPGDEKSRDAAEEKLKSINSAYEFLLSLTSKRNQLERPEEGAQNMAGQSPTAGADGNDPPPPTDDIWAGLERDERFPRWVPDWAATRKPLVYLRIAAVVCAAGFGWLIWYEFDASLPASAPAQTESAEHKPIATDGLGLRESTAEAPAAGALEKRQRTSSSPVDRNSADSASKGELRINTPQTAGGTAANPAPQAVRSAQAGSSPYFSVGSTKDEVIAVQGPPSSFTNSEFEYGLSSVSFRDGRVVGWQNYPSNPLRAKLVPETQVNSSLGYFTVGSTKDQVLAVQGTPTSFSDTSFEYGLSSVTFWNDRVMSWQNHSSNPLRVRIVPSASVNTKLGYFTVGSTKDEVLAVQGTPTSFSETAFEYGLSSIKFRDGRVVGWQNYSSNPLNVRLAPSGPVNTKLAFFTVGSTKDEVLAIQGTPSSFSETTFEYGLSSVTFQNGRVVNWQNYSSNPLHISPP